MPSLAHSPPKYQSSGHSSGPNRSPECAGGDNLIAMQYDAASCRSLPASRSSIDREASKIKRSKVEFR
jgi:hypothetical protein